MALIVVVGDVVAVVAEPTEIARTLVIREVGDYGVA